MTAWLWSVLLIAAMFAAGLLLVATSSASYDEAVTGVNMLLGMVCGAWLFAVVRPMLPGWGGRGSHER